ncbi:GNAT family N-acetyltransferase [Citrobacter telavivensis]|uniref:GNAT family N-acetyltransferase n=2 Tax=Enterobacteriaceae TaxID=543 RepID=A0A6L5ED36_9ENTR|nr:GNAT family N-acetyltransferase [Citrobacter telavivensis]MPQ52438.1 GNAT family N-acetyltransferase [Citrobacter telavivensis]QFS73983.1 GNAT family N-acetyltransferase [Citrobacter telavivensis]
MAYQSEALLYQDDSIPALQQTLESLRAQFTNTLLLKASLAEGRIVGSVRGHVVGNTCHVGRLIVHPNFQRRGIGSDLLNALERQFPDITRFELFTGHKSAGNLRLYRRHGYQEYRREPIHAGLTMIYLEKHQTRT